LHLLLRRRPSNVRVMIFGQGRSGSTLLENLLCSTGHFAKHGEILGKGACRVRFPAAFLKGSARRRPYENFICHVKPAHLRYDRQRAGARPVDANEFLRSAVADGFKIIHLRRANKLRQFVSQQMAEARGQYLKQDDRPETLKLVVGAQKLQHEIALRRQWDDEEVAALEGIDFIALEYAGDLENPVSHQPTIDRILKILSLEQRPIRTSLRKINQRPLRDIIENYDEFSAWARELGLADALD
jgi:LPS sulfotransferase NodH